MGVMKGARIEFKVRRAPTGLAASVAPTAFGVLAVWLLLMGTVVPFSTYVLCSLKSGRAYSQLKKGERPKGHSDRGCHYRWPGWIRICDDRGIVRSMSRKGCSPDNARAEGFFGRLKITDNGNRAIDEGYRRVKNAVGAWALRKTPGHVFPRDCKVKKRRIALSFGHQLGGLLAERRFGRGVAMRPNCDTNLRHQVTAMGAPQAPPRDTILDWALRRIQDCVPRSLKP